VSEATSDSAKLAGTPSPQEGDVTAPGHPRAIFRRAIERGNLLVAETTAREIGRVTLVELLILAC
jgi:hypothetical protein